MCDSQSLSLPTLLVGGGISFGFFILGLLAGEPLRIWLNRGEASKLARLTERVAGIKKLRKRLLDAQIAIARLSNGVFKEGETEFASAARAGIALIDMGFVFTHYRRVISPDLTSVLDKRVKQSALISDEMKTSRDAASPQKPTSLEPKTRRSFETLYSTLEQALGLANDEYDDVLEGK
jgi:hypothetical protein